MVNEMVFRVPDKDLTDGEAWAAILRRHISTFGDNAGLEGLLDHTGEENPFFERLIALAGEFGPGVPRSPFSVWEYVDVQLRDLIMKMTSLDPARRITARQVLEHPWFSQTD